MATLHIKNIGEFFTGDLARPQLPVKSLLIADKRIAAFDPPADTKADAVLDAGNSAVMPGLVDGHVHPVFGEWTPTQDAIGWIGNYVHGGTTTMISASELHVPGLDYGNLTPDLVTSLAVVTASTTGRVRWSGAKVHAGTVILVPGMNESHFDRLRDAGAILAKYLFFPLAQNKDEALRYNAWARERGIRMKVHTGGVSRSGLSQVCGYDILSWLQPDIAAHISGGPIPMSDDDLDKVIDRTDFALEICSSGNYGSTQRAVRRLKDRGTLSRLTLGTDTPGGTGVIPRGMLRQLCFICSICDVTPAEAVAIATGNTARAHGLDVGILAPGKPADIVVCGPVEGSAGTTVADAIAHGDLPGIAYVIIDGEIVVSGRSRQTPPPQRKYFFSCCDAHAGAFQAS
ncbi:MAG TPA: amidohydrolase family protein [Pseudolabrys sp.]|nr:amidohydrolase family protein [Pseudolabrys sp.]